MSSKFRSRDEEQFPLRKKLHRFSKKWKSCLGIFHGHSNIFFRARQPYISELNNEADLRTGEQDHLCQILGIKSSNGLIRVQQKIDLRSSLKQNYGFPSQVRRGNFTTVLIFLYFRQTDSSGLRSVVFVCRQSHPASPRLRTILSSNRGSQ